MSERLPSGLPDEGLVANNFGQDESDGGGEDKAQRVHIGTRGAYYIDKVPMIGPNAGKEINPDGAGVRWQQKRIPFPGVYMVRLRYSCKHGKHTAIVGVGGLRHPEGIFPYETWVCSRCEAPMTMKIVEYLDKWQKPIRETKDGE